MATGAGNLVGHVHRGQKCGWPQGPEMRMATARGQKCGWPQGPEMWMTTGARGGIATLGQCGMVPIEGHLRRVCLPLGPGMVLASVSQACTATGAVGSWSLSGAPSVQLSATGAGGGWGTGQGPSTRVAKEAPKVGVAAVGTAWGMYTEQGEVVNEAKKVPPNQGKGVPPFQGSGACAPQLNIVSSFHTEVQLGLTPPASSLASVPTIGPLEGPSSLEDQGSSSGKKSQQ